MPVPVYSWPPVAAVGSEWTVVSPLDESMSGITGARYASANQPERRVARLEVAALDAGDRIGAGYVEMLKRLLKGGANLVRLNSYPINWHLDALADTTFRQSALVDWLEVGVPLGWTEGAEVLWYDGTVITGTTATSNGFPAVSVTGLPPNRLVARPGEFLTVFVDADDLTGTTVQIMAPARSNGAGAAVIRLYEALPNGGRVNIGISDSAVFRVAGDLPRSMQPVGGNWSYGWEFIEVFADEVGGFTETANWYEAT